MTHDVAAHIHEADPPLHNNTVGTPWENKAIEQRVIALWADHSATEIRKVIFEEFGVAITKSQVLGKIRRLGMGAKNKTHLHKHARNLGQPRQPKKQRTRLHIVAVNGNSDCKRVVRSVEQDLPELRVIPLAPLNLTLANLPEDGCRYIAGDDLLYCGHSRRKGSSFCTGHHQICWVAPTDRNQKARGIR